MCSSLLETANVRLFKVAQEYPNLDKTEAMSKIMSYPGTTNYSRELCCACVCIIKKTCSKGKGKGLEWPRGFQEVKVPSFYDNGTG